jgi:adenylate cyclase
LDARPGRDLADFRVGIGIAHGSAIAGRIGTNEQAKVGVFGPVVNLGSRLESLTKHVGVSTLVDAATAEFVCQQVSPHEARCRLVACVRPVGMETDIAVYQLMPGVRADETITDQIVRDYESAWGMVAAGNWAAALEKLKALPPQDGPRCFLLDYLQQYNARPPDDWNGVIQMRSK